MSIEPTVSVVIPCYNGQEFIHETLTSVLKQTHAPLEVLVIDDGSTDDSAAIAESFGDPVRVIRQANQGESVARNMGMDAARGQWIALLDADDLWTPEKLEQQLAVTDADVVAVHTNLYFFGDESGETQVQDIPIEKRYAVEELAKGNTFCSPSSLLVRRHLAPRFPTWTQYAEDLIFCLELVQLGNIVLVEAPLTGYRRHQASQSAKKLTVAVDWFHTIERWLADNQQLFTAEQRDVIRTCWLSQITGAGWQLKERREWEAFWSVRDFLQDHAGHPAVDLLLANRIYPPWLYRAFDAMRLRSR